MKKYLFGIVITAVYSLCSAQSQCIGDPTARPVRSVYVVPQVTSSQLYIHWVPILERVGTETKQCFNVVVPASIPEFEGALLSGRADYAFMNPYHQVMAYRAHKYIPLVADSKNMLDGIIVVRADSPYQTIADLQNSTIAFPAPNAFAASLLPRAILTNANIKFEASYVKTHSNVYRSVILGDVSAGGGVNNTFDREPPAVKDKLRVLYRTPKYSPHPFSANPRIPKATRSAVIDSFVRMGREPEGQAMLDRVQMPIPAPVNYEDNYAKLNSLKLERFVQNGNN